MKHAKGGFLTIALFALAATLLAFSVVGSSQALLTYRSETYAAQVSMQDIGVSLRENGRQISYRNYDPDKRNFANEQDNWKEDTGALLQYMLGPDDNHKEELKLGKSYDEVLTVRNTGKIDEYVRVSVYKYWESYNEATGQWEKDPSLNSNLIDLHFTDQDGTGWTKESETEERENGESEGDYPIESTPFVDSLTLRALPIEQSIERSREYTDEYGKHVIETTYTYDNTRFVLRVDVDAVQTHHADDAMRSAWGVSY